MTLREPPRNDIWECLGALDRVVAEIEDLPVITWLLRADESVRFCTGSFDSAFHARARFWDSLRQKGHELGWHMHHASFDGRVGCFCFDPEPPWLAEAHASLRSHYDVCATRTGWDYSSNALMHGLDDLGIRLDFSALPGNVAWFKIGPDRLKVDWSRCPSCPYHPATDDYQTKGELRILEVPITQFRQTFLAGAKRLLWRSSHGFPDLRGLRNRTKKLTDFWDGVPETFGPTMAFYFHPEDLGTDRGFANFVRNLEMLQSLRHAEFVTASSVYFSSPS